MRTGYDDVKRNLWKKDFTRRPLLCQMKDISHETGELNHETAMKKLVKK